MHKAKTTCQPFSLGRTGFFAVTYRLRNTDSLAYSSSAFAVSTSIFSMASRGASFAALE
jgi:hypothetical protein